MKQINLKVNFLLCSLFSNYGFSSYFNAQQHLSVEHPVEYKEFINTPESIQDRINTLHNLFEEYKNLPVQKIYGYDHPRKRISFMLKAWQNVNNKENFQIHEDFNRKIIKALWKAYGSKKFIPDQL